MRWKRVLGHVSRTTRALCVELIPHIVQMTSDGRSQKERILQAVRARASDAPHRTLAPYIRYLANA